MPDYIHVEGRYPKDPLAGLARIRSDQISGNVSRDAAGNLTINLMDRANKDFYMTIEVPVHLIELKK